MFAEENFRVWSNEVKDFSRDISQFLEVKANERVRNNEVTKNEERKDKER